MTPWEELRHAHLLQSTTAGQFLGGLFCILSRLHFMGIIAQLVHFMVPGFSKMASCYFLQLIVNATARLWAMYCLIRIPCAYAQVLSLREGEMRFWLCIYRAHQMWHACDCTAAWLGHVGYRESSVLCSFLLAQSCALLQDVAVLCAVPAVLHSLNCVLLLPCCMYSLALLVPRGMTC